MPHILAHDAPGFDAALAAYLAEETAAEATVAGQVAEILAQVRADGAEAVAALTRRFDGWEATAETLALDPDAAESAAAQVPRAEAEALALAAERIRAYHQRQLPEDAAWEDASGITLGWRWNPVARAGLYVPGGRASYPSSLLMNAVPAQVAGVRSLVVAAPTPGGEINPLVVLAARLAGVETIWRIGGAQAVAALAYGARPIAPVDIVTGPGNAYVAEAKRQVFGKVGIDNIAGPSEVLVIADGANDPHWIALDLMAQAEHDVLARSILVTDDATLARAVAAAVADLIPRLSRAAIAGEAWAARGAIVTVRDLGQAVEIANRVAPEHLQILTRDPDAVARDIRHAGALFLGRLTPEAMGDYVAGPNHVLPTSGAARFSSGLSVLDFMKRTTVTRVGPAGMAATGPAAAALARAEGLEAHALSVEARLAALEAEP